MINLKNIVTYLSIIPSILYYNTTPQIYEQRFILTHGLENKVGLMHLLVAFLLLKAGQDNTRKDKGCGCVAI